MLPDGQVVVATRRMQTRVATIGNRGGSAIAAAFRGMPSHDPADEAAFIARIRPALIATRTASLNVAVGYYSLIAQVPAPSLTLADVLILDETAEPFIALRRALKLGHGLDEAIASGAARAEAIGRNAAVSTVRRAGDVVLERAGAEPGAWRRQADANACKWCRGLTKWEWPTSEEADFGHDRCGCTPVPVFD